MPLSDEDRRARDRESSSRSYALHRERRKQAVRLYRELNPEKVTACNKESSRRWREKNPDKARECSRHYRENNPEKVRDSQRRYEDQNREKVRASHRESSRLYYHANRAVCLAARRDWASMNADRVRQLKAKSYRKNRAGIRARRKYSAELNPERFEAARTKQSATQTFKRRTGMVRMSADLLSACVLSIRLKRAIRAARQAR